MTLNQLIDLLEHPLEDCLRAYTSLSWSNITVMTSGHLFNQHVVVPVEDHNRLVDELDAFLRANQKMMRRP